MMSIDSIFVYILILLITLLLISQSASRNQKKAKFFTFWGVLFFSVIIGCRWNVGVDYMTYYNFTIGNYVFDWELERFEPIPRYLAKWVSSTSAPFYLWFIGMAFIQIYFVQKALKKIFIPIVGWGIFLFLTMNLQEQMNIVRQGAAVCICIYAFTYIKERNFIKYISFILFASLVHKSALLCIPIYFLGYYNFNLSVLSQLSLLVIFSVVSSVVVNFLIQKFANVAVSIGYEGALNTLNNNELNTKVGSGLGIIFNYLRYVILIMFYPKLRIIYDRYDFNFYYLLLFISICSYSACFYSIYLQRLLIYFNYMNLIVFAFLLHYLYVRRYNVFYLFLLISLTGIQLFLYLWSGIPWEFIWNARQLIKFE